MDQEFTFPSSARVAETLEESGAAPITLSILACISREVPAYPSISSKDNAP